MKNNNFPKRAFIGFTLILFSFSQFSVAQIKEKIGTKKIDFWQQVQLGGSFGLNISSGYTNVLLAPSAIYHFNPYFSAGVGLQGSLVSSKNYYSSTIYGGSLIGLINPVEQIQLSVELEQLRVNRVVKATVGSEIIDNFWNTGLYLGAGFGANNVMIGARYNVLFKESDFVYSTALMPFVRVYF